MKDFIKIVNKLAESKKTISTMESCTGGAIANEITNVPGASEVIKFSAVTYSNEYKIKMGVDAKVIDKYTVYSMETAMEMSKKITIFTNSNYGVGITGQLKRFDPNNPTSNDNIVHISIYDKDNNKFINDNLVVKKDTRKENKEDIISKVIDMLEQTI